MPDYLSVSDVINLLKEAQGDQTLEVFAKKVGVSYQYVAHILRGVRQPGKSVLKFLKLKKHTLYTYTRDK